MGDEPTSLDRFDCYELCVQSPRHVVALLKGIHGGGPLVLREDFCGTAAVGRRWVEDSQRQAEAGARAIAVEMDLEVVARARRVSADLGGRMVVVQGDCLEKRGLEESNGRCDVIFVGNFSIGYCHTRSMLMGYVKRARRALAAGGVLVCDVYGGPSAFTIGEVRRRHPSRGHETIHYIWRHEEADPATGMVTNSISFDIERDGEIVERLPRAFVYRWRLWSLPELRDAMLEAGFEAVEVYTEANVAPGARPQPVEDPAELRTDWVAMVAGR